MAPLLLHPEHAEQDGFVATLVDMVQRTGVDAFAQQQNAIITRPDSRESLRRISVPTLVLCGREDAITPVADHHVIVSLIATVTKVIDMSSS